MSLNISFCIEDQHPCLAGHFPHKPIVPGVLLLDRVIHVLEEKTGEGKVQGIKHVKFLQPVLPGQRIDVEMLDTPAGIRFKGHYQGELVFNGELFLS